MNDDELLVVLYDNDIWTPDKEEELRQLNEAMENIKVELFEHRLRTDAKRKFRKALHVTREELSRLESIRHSFDHITVDGLALSSKYRYLIGSSLFDENDSPYFVGCFWHEEDPIIDKVIDIISSDRFTEGQFRELARNEPWRSIWGMKGVVGKGLFDTAAVDVSDDQRSLILWSTIYDNIREYQECPPDEVIEDDDMLDGWMIIQRRKRNQENKTQVEDVVKNKKIRNAEEIFLMADTIEDAREIDKMNDTMNALNKARRLSYLKSHGEVKEINMPDTAQRIRMELTKLEAMRMRGTQ